MKPYYEQDGITIYHADCAHVLGNLDGTPIDLLLTDPPYGIAWSPPTATDSRLNRAGAPPSDFGGSEIVGDSEPFNPGHLLSFHRVMLWGANHYASWLPVGGWVVWDKTGGGKARTFLADAELAWHNMGHGVDVFHHLWLGTFRDSEIRIPRVHPTQKPVALMRWILERWTKSGDLVLDPYMGSGPVARACLDLGRRYIGVEIVEEYCIAAVQRLAQGVLMFDGGTP